MNILTLLDFLGVGAGGKVMTQQSFLFARRAPVSIDLAPRSDALKTVN
jgi:hypothetical protein